MDGEQTDRQAGGWGVVGQMGGWTDNGHITGKGQAKPGQQGRRAGRYLGDARVPAGATPVRKSSISPEGRAEQLG